MASNHLFASVWRTLESLVRHFPDKATATHSRQHISVCRTQTRTFKAFCASIHTHARTHTNRNVFAPVLGSSLSLHCHWHNRRRHFEMLVSIARRDTACSVDDWFVCPFDGVRWYESLVVSLSPYYTMSTTVNHFVRRMNNICSGVRKFKLVCLELLSAATRCVCEHYSYNFVFSIHRYYITINYRISHCDHFYDFQFWAPFKHSSRTQDKYEKK